MRRYLGFVLFIVVCTFALSAAAISTAPARWIAWTIAAAYAAWLGLFVAVVAAKGE